MTPKERAIELTKTLWVVRESYEAQLEFVEKELTAAIAEEREACANIIRAEAQAALTLGSFDAAGCLRTLAQIVEDRGREAAARNSD
jgi:hypothetical protein